MIDGHATPDGTKAYAAAHPMARNHYREALGLTVSSLGLGSYLGATAKAARQAYTESTRIALSSGVNVLDTAANYREQASERDLGKGIRAWIDGGGDRTGIVVASKAGFLHGDVDAADGDAWFEHEYLGDHPVLRKGDVVSGHSLAPSFVKHQLSRSRRNLGLHTLDVMFLHNPEHQLEWGIDEKEFLGRVEEAFVALEESIDQGHLRSYGVATWDGLRAGADQQGHLGLVKLIHHAGAARMRVGGKASEHHFRVLQLPFNLAMNQAFLVPSQPFRFGAQTLLAAAKDVGMMVMSSASLMQMRVAGRIPPEYQAAFGTRNDAETALQFTRSTPGLTTALVGMGDPEHAKANAAFCKANAPDPGTVKTLIGTGSIHGA